MPIYYKFLKGCDGMNRFKKIKNLSIVELAHLLAETASACPKAGICNQVDMGGDVLEVPPCLECWEKYLKEDGDLS